MTFDYLGGAERQRNGVWEQQGEPVGADSLAMAVELAEADLEELAAQRRQNRDDDLSADDYERRALIGMEQEAANMAALLDVATTEVEDAEIAAPVGRLEIPGVTLQGEPGTSTFEKTGTGWQLVEQRFKATGDGCY